MQHIKILLAVFCLFTFSIQPTFASNRYSVNDMAACTPVGNIAMKMVQLRKQGMEWRIIKTSVKKNLHSQLVLWVTPIAKLVVSTPSTSSEKIVKKAIRFCLRTNKAHSKPRRILSI